MPAIDEPDNPTFSGAARPVSERGITPLAGAYPPNHDHGILSTYTMLNFRDKKGFRDQDAGRGDGMSGGVGATRASRITLGRLAAREFPARENAT